MSEAKIHLEKVTDDNVEAIVKLRRDEAAGTIVHRRNRTQ